jgi:hypothetical protein
MRFLVSFPHTSWDWYHYRERKVFEGVIEGSNEVFSGESGGKIVLFESQKNISDVVALQEIKAPQVYGMDYVIGEGLYYTTGQSCSRDGEMGNEKIVRINEDGYKDLEINNRLFSHLHSIRRTKDGLLVASTGLDAIFEVDLDGKIKWEWWAIDHGYDTLKNGEKRKLDKSEDHRLKSYPTMFQTTHLSQAIVDPYDDKKIISVLYHQNSIISISKESLDHKTLLNGLQRPHHVLGHMGGYMFTNTRERKIVFCNNNFDIQQKFGDRLGGYLLSNWIQDALPTDRGTYIVADEGNFRFLETDGFKNHYVFEYGKPDRMFEMLIVPNSYQINLKEV